MKIIKSLLAWLSSLFDSASATIHEVNVAREYEQQEPIRAPMFETPPRLPAEPQSWVTHTAKPKPVKKASKVVPLTAEQILQRSKAGNRKPTRAQRRAAAKPLKDAA